MNNASPQDRYGVWKAEGQSLTIRYSLDVMEGIRAAVVDGYYRLAHGGVEVGGVLYGSRQGDLVTVEAFRPLACEYASGPSFSLSPKDEAGLRALLEAGTSDAELGRFMPIGWYHSHTRSGILLTDRDVEIHERYFPLRWQVALVLRPEKLRPTRAGFFVREPDGTMRAASSRKEFVVEPVHSRKTVAPASLEESAPPEVAPEPAPAPETVPGTEPEPVPAPMFADVQPAPGRPGFRKWLLIAACGLVLIAAVAFAYLWGGAASRAVPLMALDVDGQLRIEWDVNSKAVKQSTAATLEITDGGAKQTMPLDAEMLRNGSVTYARASEKVDVRLILTRPGAKPVEALTVFIGPPRAVSSEESQALRKSLEEEQAKVRALERTVKELQGKLRARKK